MDNNIYFRFHDQGAIDWYVPDHASGLPGQSGSSLDDIAEHCPGKNIIVFIPGNYVHIATHLIPARNRQKIMQAIPYAMEDDLIGEIEDFHFALPAKLPQNNIPVCAIRHELMESILSAFAEFHIQPNQIIPEILALPFQRQQWTVLMEDTDSIFRTDSFSGFVCDSSQLALYLDMSINETGDEQPEAVHIIDARQLTDSDVPGLVPTPELQIVKTPMHSSLLEIFAKNTHETDSINLLQGLYAAKNQRSREWKKWIPVATILSILIFIQAIEGIVAYQSVQSELEQTNARISKLFKQSLPDAKRVNNIKIRMKRRLIALQGSGQSNQSGFLSLLAKSAKAIQVNTSTVINNMNFRNGKLDMELRIDNLQSLEKIKQMITQSGLNVNVRSASVQGNSVTVRMSVQEKQS